MSTIELLDPAGQVETSKLIHPQPIKDLTGCRLVILDNAKPNFRALATRLAQRIGEDFAIASVRTFVKENAAVAALPEVLDEISRSADLVLTGSAD